MCKRLNNLIIKIILVRINKFVNNIMCYVLIVVSNNFYFLFFQHKANKKHKTICLNFKLIIHLDIFINTNHTI